MAAEQAAAIALRVILAVGGGYGVAAGLAALLSVVLAVAGVMPRSEAAILASMLAFVLYLAVLLWAFAVRRLSMLCAGLAVAGVAGWGGAYGLSHLAGAH